MTSELLRKIIDFQPLIIKVIAKRVPREHLEDLVQETTKRAVANLSKLKNEEALGGWLVRIASSVVADYYRVRYLVQEVHAGAATMEKAYSKFALDSFEESDSSVMYRELVALVISRLEPDDKRIVECVYINGLDHAEAAAQLGITETNLRVRMHRARAKLRDIMAQYHDSVEFFGCRIAHGGEVG